jgi:ABC-type transporter Mla subunit MlaD
VRRLALISGVLALAAVIGVLLLGPSAQGSSTARIDVLFDDARGLIAGQLFKIAGAPAGTISDVTVTPDVKARIEATVDSRFTPFRQNASCSIRPSGLIAENYVDCDPGTPSSPPLKASGGYPPTVPVAHTSEPVSLLDLFNIFNLPTRERFAVLINELGIGTAGEGQNFNDILRRANPALASARRAISILQRQSTQLATFVDATNTIAAQAANHTVDLQNFLDRAAALATTTARHGANLSLAINRLPGLLAAARPALQQLDTVAVDGTPLLEQIHTAAPALDTVANDLGPFVRAARPALSELGGTLRRAIPAIRHATGLVRVVRSYARKSLASTGQMSMLLSNLQRHGFFENFQLILYGLGALFARYDSISHLGVAYLTTTPNPLCVLYATTPAGGCSANYGNRTAYTPSRARTLQGLANYLLK